MRLLRVVVDGLRGGALAVDVGLAINELQTFVEANLHLRQQHLALLVVAETLLVLDAADA